MAVSMVGTVCYTAFPIIVLLYCLIIYCGKLSDMNIMNIIIKTIGVGTMALVGLPVQTVPTVVRCRVLKKAKI